MRLKSSVCLAALAIALLSATVLADQIILRDGTTYSGKFIRGDSKVVEFRILSKIESFNISDIDRIVFKEPELQAPANPRSAVPPSAPIPSEKPALQPTTSPTPPPPVVQNAPAQADLNVTFPAGTPVVIRTTTAIDTDRNRVGDVFDAILSDPMVLSNQTIFPRGTAVKGRIAYAKESGKITGQSQLVLELTDIIYNDRTYSLRTSDYTETGSSRGNRTAATVGGTAALGAIIGAIAGGGTGAAVGAASGAAVGTGVQVMTRGEVLKIPAETVLEFKLQSPMKISNP
jgi:hypothetical protein